MHSWYVVMKKHFISLVLHQNYIPWSNHEKNLRQIPIEGLSTKYLTSILQNDQDHIKNKRSLKKFSSRVA